MPRGRERAPRAVNKGNKRAQDKRRRTSRREKARRPNAGDTALEAPHESSAIAGGVALVVDTEATKKLAGLRTYDAYERAFERAHTERGFRETSPKVSFRVASGASVAAAFDATIPLSLASADG